MITINLVGDVITGTYAKLNGGVESYGVSYSVERWNAMQELKKQADQAADMATLRNILEQFEPLTKESYKDLAETASPYLFVNKATNQFFLKNKNVISTEPMPKAFADRIIESLEKRIEPTPLIKAWARFLRNPNYSQAKAQLFAWYINQTYTNHAKVQELMNEGLSHEHALALATTFQTPITTEGLLCTYKVSREITKRFVKHEEGVKQVDLYDYDVDEYTGLKKYKEPEHAEDRFFEPAVMGQHGDAFGMYLPTGLPSEQTLVSKGHIIKVGHIHRLDSWDQVDCDDRKSGVKGLHCGNLDYIRCFQKPDTVTHEVLVDPMHIGAIVNDNTGALRVLSYFVHRSFVGINRNIYHSATYAKINDDEFAWMVAEASKVRDESIAKLHEAHDAKADLV